MQEKIIIFCLLLVLLFQYSLSNLIGVIQLNRHGARTGRHFSNFTSKLFYGSGEEQLTINGFRQVEKLGQWIAERYIYYDYNLLSPFYDPEEILVKTSSKVRTIFSAAGFMKGMYPFSEISSNFLSHCKLDENCKYLKEDDVPPIANYSSKRNLPKIKLSVANANEDLIFHTDQCRLFINSTFTDNLKHNLVRKEIYNITNEEIKSAIDDTKSKWQEPFIGLSDETVYTKIYLKYLYSFIAHTEYHYDNKFFNLAPSTTLLMKKIQIEEWYSIRLVENWALKLINSPIYDNLLIHLDAYVKRQERENHKLKYLLLSGHDTSIVNIISTLFRKEKLMEMIADYEKYYDVLQPPYASSFIIEVHSKSNSDFNSNKSKLNLNNQKHSFYVRIIYNGNILERDTLHEDLTYDQELKGIDYENFRKFLIKKIDKNYKYLDCNQ